MRRINHAVVAWLVAVLLSGCGGGADDALQKAEGAHRTARALAVSSVNAEAVGVADVTAITLSKVSEVRVSRTVFEYVLRPTFRNGGATDYDELIATLTAAGPGTSIVDSVSTIGSLSAGQSVAADTITIRQDRTVSFDPTKFQWSVVGMPRSASNPGVLVIGPANEPAADQLPNFLARRSVQDMATAQAAANGPTYYVKQVTAALGRSVSVSRINAALQATGARIVFSQFRNPVVTLQVTATNVDEMLVAVQTLRAQGVFAAVAPIARPDVNAIPGGRGLLDASGPKGRLLNHAAVGVLSVWNADAALSGNGVELIIVDSFGLTNDSENLNYDNLIHGHVVGGIINNAGDVGVIGVAKNRTQLNDLIDWGLGLNQNPAMTPFEILRREIQEKIIGRDNGLAPHVRVQHRAKNWVINFSTSYSSGLAAPSAEAVASDAVLWRMWARSIFFESDGERFDYESRVLQISSAGNDPLDDAKLRSPFNASILLGALRNPADNSFEQPLRNGLVVEARVARPADIKQPVPRAGCTWMDSTAPDGGSSVGGNVSAIGANIYWRDGAHDKWVNGTSFAAPQVAGAALLLWSRQNILPATAIVEAVIGNARAALCEGPGQDQSTTPVIDAYATVLAADEPSALTAQSGSAAFAPVRTAILDLDGDGAFTAKDAKVFIDAFQRAKGASAYQQNWTIEVPQVDGSKRIFDPTRFDLNGDGYLGGRNSRSFNLNADLLSGRVQNLTDAEFIDPSGTRIRYDENRVTDLQVLCFYLHSLLFNARDGLVSSVVTELSKFGFSCDHRCVTLQSGEFAFLGSNNYKGYLDFRNGNCIAVTTIERDPNEFANSVYQIRDLADGSFFSFASDIPRLFPGAKTANTGLVLTEGLSTSGRVFATVCQDQNWQPFVCVMSTNATILPRALPGDRPVISGDGSRVFRLINSANIFTTNLMTGSDSCVSCGRPGPPRQMLISAVAEDGKAVLAQHSGIVGYPAALILYRLINDVWHPSELPVINGSPATAYNPVGLAPDGQRIVLMTNRYSSGVEICESVLLNLKNQSQTVISRPSTYPCSNKGVVDWNRDTLYEVSRTSLIENRFISGTHSVVGNIPADPRVIFLIDVLQRGSEAFPKPISFDSTVRTIFFLDTYNNGYLYRLPSL